MSEKIKTAIMEVIKAHMDGEDKNTKAVLSDVMESVNELETLEQEPTEKPMTVDEMEREYEKSKALFHKIVEYDDAISREAVKEALRNRTGESISECINAIPPINPQPCDDAISRDWLKTAIHNFYYGLKHTPTEEDIQAYIDVAPSVKQKPIECEDAIGREDMLDAIGHGTTYTSEELQKVIQNLPPVNPKPCDDAVSRQAVKEQLNCWIGSGEYRYAMSERFLIDRINDLPPVTQNYTVFHCPKCGYQDAREL